MEDPAHEEMRNRISQLEQEVRDQRLKLHEQKNLEEQLIQAQKMESLANLAAGIAHDFNNILQSILGLTQLAIYRKTIDAQDLKTFQQIEKIIGRGRELTEQFLTLGRRKLPAFAPLDLNRRVRDTARLLRRTIPKMVEIELTLAPELKEIQADEGQIEQVLMNLSLNARDAMTQGGRLAFKTESVHLEPNHPLLDQNARPGDYVMSLRLGRGMRDPGGEPETHLRALFHHQVKRQGNRAWFVHRVCDREEPWRVAPLLKQGRGGNDLFDAFPRALRRSNPYRTACPGTPPLPRGRHRKRNRSPGGRRQGHPTTHWKDSGKMLRNTLDHPAAD